MAALKHWAGWLEPAFKHLLMGALILGWIPFVRLLQAPAEFLKLWGLLLELAGVWTTWEQVRQGLGSEQPRHLDRLRAWWRAMPGRSRIVAAAGTIALEFGMAARGRVRHRRADDTPEARIAANEVAIAALEQELDAHRTETDRCLHELRQELQEERAARETLARESAEQLRDIRVGSIDLQMTGIVWISTGIVLSTFPEWLIGLVAN